MLISGSGCRDGEYDPYNTLFLLLLCSHTIEDARELHELFAEDRMDDGTTVKREVCVSV